MEIPFTHEQEAELAATAEHQGKNVADLVIDSVRLQTEKYYDEKLKRSIAQADRGEFIEEEEMDRRFAEMISGK